MNRANFLSDFKEYVGAVADISPETRLADLPEWDSLTAVSVVTLLAAQYDANLTLADVQQAGTVGGIMDKAGIPA